ncbi:hypothetical protein SAMN06296036_1148 [Pseudobacteriovorax antillogorgiicola]|uniref:Uncharacterized protein n=2 Tax=Pseudobacteriovorax antillogorgiicola TaxID=1513793 RepID=A0A1Y6C6M4_9BACT|nr:hypothetical protein EDD56_115177 [Pseudobacteriovorax antillogorgiicola]SMF45934.1 hypothetical protein SAMN06296036_1148 [Pseudobacteriovorax antillogorgiicola]
MNQTFCPKQQIPDRQAIWQADLFDTSLEIQSVSPKTNVSVSIKQLSQAAQKIATRSGHKGYAFGICPNRVAWVITTPAPQPLMETIDHSVQIKLTPLTEACRAVRIDFAATYGGDTRALYRWPQHEAISPTLTIEPKFLPPGTLSVTCKPKNKYRGPELWALYPVHNMKPVLPARNLIQESPSSLKAWVNEIRIREGLPPLSDQLDALQETGERLSQKMTVSHDRRLIKREKTFLKKNQIKFLGENRVQARSTNDMAWLLWNSPRHRSLLMSPRATHFSLATQTTPQKSLAVLVFAKRDTPLTGNNP